jgi:hypothetical protein
MSMKYIKLMMHRIHIYLQYSLILQYPQQINDTAMIPYFIVSLLSPNQCTLAPRI